MADEDHKPTDAVREYYDAILGQGPGDGDLFGYPGETEGCAE
jgi:hypothetical protein